MAASKPTNKHDAEIEKAHAGAQKFSEGINLARVIVVCATVMGSIYICWSGLKGLVPATGPQLEGMAKIIQAFKLSDILHYALDGVLGVSLGISRRNTKRALKEKARFQALAEGNPGRSSSGLTPGGTTP